MKCQNCGKEFEGREGAKFCSPKCRVTFSRKSSINRNTTVTNDDSVTPNVTFSEPVVTDKFEFTIKLGPNDHKRRLSSQESTIAEQKNQKREAKYWYNVPLCGIPVIRKGWPEMPEYMNGRQYFLWWKNDFKTNQDPQKGQVDAPMIFNPYPQYETVGYVQASEQSRRWGS